MLDSPPGHQIAGGSDEHGCTLLHEARRDFRSVEIVAEADAQRPLTLLRPVLAQLERKRKLG